MADREISRAVIKRLPRYYRYLDELLKDGVERISSGELSAKMHITASQIRQDLNNFGGFGQQGYGYNVRHLYNEIGKILGLEKTYNMIIVGAGNLGQAIANYANFERRGFVVQAMFDINPKLHNKIVRGIQVHSMEDLEGYIKEHDVQIAALTLPKEGAQRVLPELIKSGIKGIWNFAHTDLQVPDDVVVENVHLSESLMRISYQLSNAEHEKDESGSDIK